MPPSCKDNEQPPQLLEGICVGVSDGDSLHLELPDGERVRVRLYGIDAPERTRNVLLLRVRNSGNLSMIRRFASRCSMSINMAAM